MNQRTYLSVLSALAVSWLAACSARRHVRPEASPVAARPLVAVAEASAPSLPAAGALSADAPVAGPEAQAAGAPAAQASASAPRVVDAWLALEGGERGGVRVSSPEGGRGPAPLTVLLHGMCNDPEITCGWFRPGELRPTWQVCPAGPVRCGWGYQWGGGRSRNARRVREAVERVEREFSGHVSGEGAVVAGFSQGAYAALDAAQASPGAFVGLVLVAAKVAPRPSDLRAAGVRRVGFAAGDADAAAAPMRAAAAALSRDGVETRYLSLGRVGHFIPDDTSGPIGELIEWARSAGPPPRADVDVR